MKVRKAAFVQGSKDLAKISFDGKALEKFVDFQRCHFTVSIGFDYNKPVVAPVSDGMVGIHLVSFIERSFREEELSFLGRCNREA